MSFRHEGRRRGLACKASPSAYTTGVHCSRPRQRSKRQPGSLAALSRMCRRPRGSSTYRGTRTRSRTAVALREARTAA
eukprot:scaffold48462_cov60-Phaeocystis_antarctica.AAC.1